VYIPFSSVVAPFFPAVISLAGNSVLPDLLDAFHREFFVFDDKAEILVRRKIIEQ